MSLIHLLDNIDCEDNHEVHIIKHSSYYNESDFSKHLNSKGVLRILRICRDPDNNHCPKQIVVYELEKLNIYGKLHAYIN